MFVYLVYILNPANLTQIKGIIQHHRELSNYITCELSLLFISPMV